MNKIEYIEMLLQDNETEADKAKKVLYEDLIDCTEIALSQTSNSFTVDTSIGLPELWQMLEDAAEKDRMKSMGLSRAAELIAERIGTKYVRASRRRKVVDVNLDDLL